MERPLLRDYWDRFYAKPHPELREPSGFARFCAALLPVDASVFELGCGTGRDALFFARNGFAVTACDQSTTAIEQLSAFVSSNDGWPIPPRFFVRRFEDLDDDAAHDVIYSRFTLHAVDATTASQTLRWAHRNLRPGGRLFIEARTVKDARYGTGEACGPDAFLQDGHYRRFVRAEQLAAELAEIGFDLAQLTEGNGMATFGSDDPVVVRAVASRPEYPSGH